MVFDQKDSKLAQLELFLGKVAQLELFWEK
jgi:hypothetical protein